MKKIGFLFVFLFSVMFVFGINDNVDEYVFEVELNEGWNLIAGLSPMEAILVDSEIQSNDLSIVWYYSPFSKEYFQIYPNLDENALKDDDDYILTTSMWVYSKKSGTLKYSSLEQYPNLEERVLYSGWNFVSITPDMVDQTLDEMKGTCDWTSIYTYAKDGGESKWMDLLNNPNFVDKEKFNENMFGIGLIIKVTEECTLGSPVNLIAPPSIPSN